MTEKLAPLRVLHLTAGSEPGGLSRYLYDLCAAMTAGGHRVAIAGRIGAAHALFQNAPWPWINLPLNGGPLALWSSAKKLRAYLADHPVDILHAHYRRSVYVGRLLQRSLPGIPLLYTLHLSHLSLRWPWQRMLSDFGDHVHVASRQAQRWLIEQAGYDAQGITFIPHGVDPLCFPQALPADRAAARRSLKLADSDLVALYAGRLEYPKNVAWMLDLAAAALHKLPALHVLLAGNGPDEQSLRARIASRGLANRVRILGFLDNPLAAYQAADALLLPSLREGFSLVCAEAMSVGTPVLRTNTSGSEELILEAVTGRSVPIDHDAFIAAAIDFLSDRGKLAAMGRAAAQHVRDHYTSQRQLTQTLELYRRLAAGVHSAG